MVEAVRKEAFVQGWLRAYATSCRVELRELGDEKILSLLPIADVAYVAYRAERGGK
jgi:hypothetical protein